MVHLFKGSFGLQIYWFIDSSIHRFICSIVNWFIGSTSHEKGSSIILRHNFFFPLWLAFYGVIFIGSLVKWLIGSVVHWFICSLVQWCIVALIHLFILWFFDSLVHCLINWLIDFRPLSKVRRYLIISVYPIYLGWLIQAQRNRCRNTLLL